MALTGENIAELARQGKLNSQELEESLGSTGNALVTVQDWGVCYSPATGQLSEYCTVVTNNNSNPITGIGMIAYSANGSTLYAVQYTNGFSTDAIAPSLGTGLYNQSMGNQALCIVYGWTNQGSFYFSQTMTIQSC